MAKKFASDAVASESRLMWVMKRGPFTANRKPGGVSAYQRAKSSGRCCE